MKTIKEIKYEVWQYTIQIHNNEEHSFWEHILTCDTQYQAIREAQEIWGYGIPSRVIKTVSQREIIDEYGEIEQ